MLCRSAAGYITLCLMIRRALVLLPFLFGASVMAHADPKSECEDLLNAALPFAERMLREHGSFYPYGMALENSGKVASVGATDGQEKPKPTELIQLLVA